MCDADTGSVYYFVRGGVCLLLLLLWEGEKGTGEELRLRGQFSVVDSCGLGGASDVVADDAAAADARAATYGDAAIVALLTRGGYDELLKHSHGRSG